MNENVIKYVKIKQKIQTNEVGKCNQLTHSGKKSLIYTIYT